jgi:hypothetical protein
MAFLSKDLSLPSFNVGFNEPLDQSFVRFRDGWTDRIVGKYATPGLRWAPGTNGGDWDTYELNKWEFLDFGEVGPKSPLKANVGYQATGPWYEWNSSLTEAPELWRKIQEVYDRLKGARPTAVWNPYDGSWREMRRSKEKGPGTTPPPPGFAQRVKLLQVEYDAGRITDEIYKTRLLELTREYI